MHDNGASITPDVIVNSQTLEHLGPLHHHVPVDL